MGFFGRLACSWYALVSVALAQDYVGLDVLALAKQDISVLRAALPNNCAIGALEGTFGSVSQSLRALLRTGKVPAYRIHLLNGPCHRNGNCERTEPALTDLKALLRRSQRIERVAKAFPDKPCFISPVLEYDERHVGTIRNWLRTLQRGAPSCTPVLSVSKGRTLPGYLTERHGKKSHAGIVSNDGLPLASLKKAKASTVLFAWLPSFNRREANEAFFVPPSKRTIVATKKDYETALLALK